MQLGLPDVATQQALPFQTMEMGGCPYKLFGIVTDRDLPGEELIQPYRRIDSWEGSIVQVWLK